MAKTPAAHTAKKPKRSTPDERIPRRVVKPGLDNHLEIITRAIFQAGLSWAMIDARWESFRRAFDFFDVRRVAEYGDFEMDRIMAANGIVHSAKKIAGTIQNASALITLEREFGSVEAYIAKLASYADILADARGRFAFMGDLSCYYWLFRTGNPVPKFEDWIAGQPKDHPRIREMVMAGRSDGTSSERDGF
jgi:3-methyladenine DNA glycosylase Tag